MNRKAGLYLKILVMLAITIILILVSTSCIRIVGLSGSGNVVSEDRNVSEFNGVYLSSGMNLYIEQTGTETLKIEAEDNIIPMIVTEVVNGTLNIKYKKWTFGLGGINTGEPVNIYLTVKDLNRVSLSSGSFLECNELKTDNLAVNVSSGATGNIAVDVNDLKISLSSGSNLEISGKAGNQYIGLSSGAQYDAEELESRNAVLNVSSGATAIVNVSSSLDVDISSGGTVKYKGSPEITSDISSGATLRSISGD